MAYSTRTNPQTGKTEYKVRYYFMRDGKKRDSETSWFSSLEKAQKEAKSLKEKKEKEDRYNLTQRRDKKMVTAFEEYLELLKIQADKEASNYNRMLYRISRAIHRYHMPLEIQETRIKDLSVYTWKSWLSQINQKDEIGGGYIRQIRNNLVRFNVWLSQNGYYIDEEQEENTDYGIKKVKIKNSKVNNRERNGLRCIISLADIQKITRYYVEKENGLGEFRNFYYYTLFLVLFFSGMRIEELTALQWKFIDLRDGQRVIKIINAISQIENPQHALERVKRKEYRTKNITSVRTIPIFDFYYELLKDYKESYRYQYELSKEEIEECFVFPKLRGKEPRHFMKEASVLLELKKVLNKLEMPSTDLQMFRHSCATFLILPYPDGLGFTEEKVKDYFGHQDTSMLTQVYARLNEIQKAERMRQTFEEIYSPDNDKNSERNIEEIMKEKMLKQIMGDNEREKRKARRIRIHNQIKQCIKMKKKEYMYLKKDKDIIDDFIKNNKNVAIEFIEEKE